MEHVLGITAILGTFAMVSMLSFRAPRMTLVLFGALTLRTIAALHHFYVAPLPDSQSDAATFERIAWSLASSPGTILENFEHGASYFYSVGLAALYSVTDRSPLMLQFVSVMVGTVCVYLTWILARELWNERTTSRVAACLLAIAPTAILYSAMTRREVFFSAALLLGLVFVVRWVRHSHYRDLAFAYGTFAVGLLVHGGMAVAIAALTLHVAATRFSKATLSLLRGYVAPASFLIVALGVSATVALVAIDPALPKLGSITALIDPQHYLDRLGGIHGNAQYPGALAPDTVLDLLWVAPLRVVYFLMSPFPWDVSQPSHWLGLIDGTLYGLIAVSILMNWRSIVNDRAAMAVLLILAGLTVAFAFGTSNFGTAVRHRAKLMPVMLVLGAPVLAQIATKLRLGANRPVAS